MQTTENQRIKILREHLNLSQFQFSAKIEMKQGSISDIERGKARLSSKIIDRLSKDFYVNKDWLKTGEGDMFIANNMLNEPEAPYKITPPKLTPVYNHELSPDALGKLFSKGSKDLPMGYLSIPEVRNCDLIITAKGDSMSPKIDAGDWIGIKLIDNWKERLPLDQIYVIYTDQYELIRYIKKGSTDQVFKLSATNKFYQDEEIPKELIRKIYIVKAIIPMSKTETLI